MSYKCDLFSWILKFNGKEYPIGYLIKEKLDENLLSDFTESMNQFQKEGIKALPTLLTFLKILRDTILKLQQYVPTMNFEHLFESYSTQDNETVSQILAKKILFIPFITYHLNDTKQLVVNQDISDTTLQQIVVRAKEESVLDKNDHYEILLESMYLQTTIDFKLWGLDSACKLMNQIVKSIHFVKNLLQISPELFQLLVSVMPSHVMNKIIELIQNEAIELVILHN